MNTSPLRLAAWAALPLLAAGCTSLPPDAGLAAVAQATRPHLAADLAWARSETETAALDARAAQLLQEPLDADAAVQVALLRHRGLQAQLAELGIAEAEILQAARLPNPGFSFARLRRGHEIEIERGLHWNLARLLTLPWAAEQEARRRPLLQAWVAQQVLDHAFQTRRAWIAAVAATEALAQAQRVMDAAGAGAELARRMREAGNFSSLQQAREQAFEAEAAIDLLRAQQLQRSTHERLARLLGLGAEPAALRLPERLPDLPPQPADDPARLQRALAGRLDVQSARLAVEQTAQALGLVRRTRWINVLELGWQHNGSNEAPVQRGWEVSFELPLFDWGGARVARAESVYMQALHRAARTASDAASQLREADALARGAWQLARHHREQLVPLRQRISEQNLLRYNGMLIGLFELLADARRQIAGVDAAIAATRDFWLAQAALDQARVGTPLFVPPAAAGGGSRDDAAH